MSAPPPVLLLLCLLLGGAAAAAAAAETPRAAASELSILLDFKAALAAASPATFASWRADNPPCRFPGVRCNSLGAVAEIDLGGLSLHGAVPFATLCRLPSLSKLWLGNTGISGNLTGIAACAGLQFLDLAYNSLSGELPDLSSLRNIKVLNLSGNGFSGDFPWASLDQMPDLQSLSLGDNPFRPTAAFPAEILRKTKLRWLYLSNCSIHGEIPAGIANLTELVNLELADNDLYGEIPPEISKLTSLWQLELYDNRLTGNLPRGFGDLGNLASFDASHNNLGGDLSEIGRLTKLVSLQLFENNFTGGVPPEIGDFRDLVNLSLYTNRLTGELPPALGSWAEFDFIDVSTNMLTGPIPPNMCRRGTMTKLLMLENQFTGAIPASYANCSTLLRFRVSNNSLSGEVPAGIWGLPKVKIIDLAFNRLSGAIDAGIGNAKELSQLVVSDNLLSGTIPPQIAGATSLVSIDAANNQIAGEIPASIGDLKALGSVNLQGNRLGGQIPASVGACSALTLLNVGDNALSGEIPGSLQQLSNLNSLNLSRNKLTGEIPGGLASLKLSALDLSGNRLSGPVPPGLAIEAYGDSFAGNPGLCGYRVRFLQSCAPYATADSSNRRRAVLACLLLGAFALLFLSGYFIYVKRRQRTEEEAARRRAGRDNWDMKSFRVVSFDEQEIVRAVRRENLIGKGGSGNVYRVDLPGGTTVAVKHIWNQYPAAAPGRGDAAAMLRRKGGRALSEFDAEVVALSGVRHVNVVKLICSITSEDSSLLVYEFLPNGSLWERLHTGEGGKLGGLDWEARYEVALGAARGLEYLHHGLQRPILHRDVKSSNILLDESFMPRIADFGLAKMLQATAAAADGKGADPSSTTHVVAGTHGYIAPEYAYTAKVNEKSDVYSFGVVLLELVTGRRPIEPEYGENRDIVHWVYTKMTSAEGAKAVVDARLPAWARDEAAKVLRVGVLCTMRLPSLRPSMRAAVQLLEDVGRERLADLDRKGVVDHLKEAADLHHDQPKLQAAAAGATTK